MQCMSKKSSARLFLILFNRFKPFRWHGMFFVSTNVFIQGRTPMDNTWGIIWQWPLALFQNNPAYEAIKETLWVVGWGNESYQKYVRNYPLISFLAPLGMMSLYIWNMKFEDKPDYEFIQSCLVSIVQQSNQLEYGHSKIGVPGGLIETTIPVKVKNHIGNF